MARRLIVIGGPTASGKTALSLQLATSYNAEVFSADARQFYRLMDIGTAKPTKEERAEIPHHFIDSLDPDQAYTAGKFAEELRDTLESYYARKETAILVGGSGFYIKAAIEGLDQLPGLDQAIRERWNERFKIEGLTGFLTRLKNEDPAYYEEVDRSNVQRVQRALEVMDQSGEKFSELRKNNIEPLDAHVAAIWLAPEREVLYSRINQRVDEMMQGGLLDEVKSLTQFKQSNALQTVGYKELFAYLDGNCTLEEAVEKIKQHSRNYAKRQLTWFKKQEGFKKFETADFDLIKRHLDHTLNV